MRTISQIMQAEIRDLDAGELRVREAFVDIAECFAKYNDVLASGPQCGFRISVSPEMIEAMRHFKPHFGQIENAIFIFDRAPKV